MHASDLVEPLPTARLDDDLLSAIRMVLQQGLPGLVAADERGTVIACVSLVDLVRVALPRYLRDAPVLVRTVDEGSADRVAAALVGARVADAVEEAATRTPVVRPSATAVELAEIMARQRCSLVLVDSEGDGPRGVVTANRLLDLLVAGAEGPPR